MTLLQNDIKNAFDQIYAEKELKDNTLSFISHQIEFRQKFHLRKIKKHVLVCTILIICMGIRWFSSNIYSQSMSYIDIDVNPSLELAVNRYGRIVDVYAYNDDGSKILQGLKLKNKPYYNATETIFNAMKDMGYIKEQSVLSVTVQSYDETDQKNMLDILKNMAENFIDEKQVSIYSVSEETKHNSHNHHITPAKYLAIAELQEVDPTATIERCKNLSIDQLEQMTHGHESGHQHNYQNDETKTETSSSSNNSSHHGCGMCDNRE